MEGAYPQWSNRYLEQLFDPVPHLLSSFVGEGDRQKAVGRDPFSFNQPGNPMHEHPGFTTARAGHDQHIPRGRSNRLALGVIEIVEYV